MDLKNKSSVSSPCAKHDAGIAARLFFLKLVSHSLTSPMRKARES